MNLAIIQNDLGYAAYTYAGSRDDQTLRAALQQWAQTPRLILWENNWWYGWN